MADRRLPFDSAVATGRGDDGSTGLLFGGDRIRKDDLRTEAFGALDEAVAALGLARAELNAMAEAGNLPQPLDDLAGLVLRLQRELFVAGAELATDPRSRDRQRDGETRVSAAMVEGIEDVLRAQEAAMTMPREFVVPGETRVSAGLELARTIVRRAERRAVTLAAADEALASGHLLPYVNRLADLLWILARAAEAAESRDATVARPDRGHGRGRGPTTPGAPTR
jgi:cob(I)alamin adenosyltransferase